MANEKAEDVKDNYDLRSSILKLEGNSANEALLNNIPESSYHALYQVLLIYKDHFKQKNPLSYFKQQLCWVDEGYDRPNWIIPLNDDCHENFALAYFVMQDPWMRGFIYDKEKQAIPERHYLHLSYTAILLASIQLILFTVMVAAAGFFSSSEMVFSGLMISLIPPLLILALGLIHDSLISAWFRDAPHSSIQAKANAFKHILELKAESKNADTLLDQEKNKISDFLNQKKSDLVKEKGFRYYLFYSDSRRELKITAIDKALDKIAKAQSLIELAECKEKLLSETDLVDRRSLGLGYSDTYEGLLNLCGGR